jgi:hypothetical protein
MGSRLSSLIQNLNLRPGASPATIQNAEVALVHQVIAVGIKLTERRFASGTSRVELLKQLERIGDDRRTGGKLRDRVF